MKINVEIDCTPEEARRFMGLPDLTPVHEVYIEQMKRALSEGLSPDLMDAMMKSWAPLGEAGMGMWRQMLGSMGGASGEK